MKYEWKIKYGIINADKYAECSAFSYVRTLWYATDLQKSPTKGRINQKNNCRINRNTPPAYAIVLGNEEVTSSLSRLKNLLSLNFRNLFEQITNGSDRYEKKSSPYPSNDNNPLYSKASGIPIAISKLPKKADLYKVLRSLVKSLAIINPLNTEYFIKFIIPQKGMKNPIILLITLGFIGFSNSVVASEGCQAAITKYEKLYKIPTGLLKAVSKVESDWRPFAVNEAGNSSIFKSKGEVIEHANKLIETGKTNFDLGCMQLNYYWHGKYFESVDEMVEVNANVRYAAAFLQGLYKQHGTWLKAVKYYHSSDKEFNRKYSMKVAIAWLEE